MKKTLIISAIALLTGIACFAQSEKKLSVSSVEIAHEGDLLTLSMNVVLSDVYPDNNVTIVYVPKVVAEGNESAFDPIAVYSRGRFYSLARDKRSADPLEGYNYYYKTAPESIKYKSSVPYEDWMDGAAIRVDDHEEGCCGKVKPGDTGVTIGSWEEPVPEPVEFVPNFVYVKPDAEPQAKTRSISGEAYVIFRTGKNTLEPEYEGNAGELAKIRATIDSVRLDNDVTITGISLIGYSSPDGNYKTNEKLASERTQSLKKYVSGLYPFAESIWFTDSVAENWEGLRKAVKDSDALANKAKILDIIDSDLAPDKKEAKIKSSYPKDWKYLVSNVFPTLRRTDYKVSYTVRSYTSVDEVRAIMRTRPRNLSIEEFFLAAQNLEPGTDEYNEVFSLAAYVYPDDEVANINAANAFMSSGNLDRAARYLARTGDSPVATYTKGVYSALNKDFTKAIELFRKAENEGLGEASQARSLVELILSQEAAAQK